MATWGMFDVGCNQNPYDVSMDEGATVGNRDICLPHFRCMGKVNVNDHSFHPEGFVCSGEFDSLLNSRVPHAGFLDDEDDVQIFNHSFCFEEAFVSDSSILLGFAKTHYERIECAAKGSQISTVLSNKSMKQSLVEFLAYSRTYVHRFLSIFGQEDGLPVLYEKLEQTIEKVALWLTAVSDIPAAIFSGGSLNNDSALSLFFHLYFDIRWSLVEMACMAANSRKYSDSCRSYRDRFSEILLKLQENLCADLMYLSFRRYLELNPTELPGVSPFSCTCIQELWFMLLTMLKSSETSIFSLIQRILQSALDNSSSVFFQTFKDSRTTHMPTKDPVAVVWLITHLAKLSGFSPTGVWDKNHSRIEPAYDVINKLVQAYASGVECAPTEDRSKGLIGCLYSLSHIWGSNLNLCIYLWDHYSRRVDENFSPPSAFDPVPYSSSVSWFESLCSNLEPWKSPTTKYNSYFLFLKLLGHHLEAMNPKNQASMKARLFVKLQGKKIQDLSPLGVYHMMSACLTVVLTSDSPDMSAKMLELSSESVKHKAVFFAAEMVLLLALINRGRDCKEVAASISTQLEKISRGLKDGELREDQRKFGSVFVEGLQEVVAQSRNFTLGQIKLIDKPLCNYLKSCGSCDRSSIIDALTSLLKKLKLNPTLGEEMISSVMTHVYPLMKDKFADADYVSFFTELTSVSLETSQISEFQAMFSHFCLDEKVDAKFSLHYLSQLLDNKQFTVNLSLSLDNYQSILIQSWFRISFLLPNNIEYRNHMEKINNVIRRLPKMAELTVHSKITPNRGEMILDFLLMLSASLQNIQNFNERAIVRDVYLQYIGPLDRYLTCGNITSSWEPSDQVGHILRLGAHLFFHCGNIIYTKGKADCLLVLLTNVVLTPLSFADLSKDLPSSVAASFQQHLPMYVFGLIRLNPARDPYVVRSLSSVFQTFMTRYQPNLTHPFTRCWMGLDSEPVTESLVPHVRTWFLQTIANNVLPQRVARTSPFLAPTLQWLKFLVANQEWRLEIVKGVMLPILELSLILDEIQGKKSVTDFLQVAICGQDSAQMKVAEEALNELVSRQLAFNSNRLFKLIEVVSFLNNDLVKRIFPNIKNQVAITEAKRGTGADSILRQHLRTLEISLS